MTDNTTTQKYRELRRKDSLLPARHAFSQAKSDNARDKWDGDDHDFKREVDGFDIKLHVEEESIYPMPNRNGDTDYGSYVDEIGNDYNYDWEGNWPQPQIAAPLGIPYTSIRYSGPGWTQGEGSGYFIPDGIEDQFAYYRSAGQSKSVAWDMTRKWVEDQLSMLFSSPLTNCVVYVKVYKEDIELGSTAMGTDVSGDTEGWNYIFDMVEEHGMIEEAIEEAKSNIDKLTAA